MLLSCSRWWGCHHRPFWVHSAQHLGEFLSDVIQKIENKGFMKPEVFLRALIWDLLDWFAMDHWAFWDIWVPKAQKIVFSINFSIDHVLKQATWDMQIGLACSASLIILSPKWDCILTPPPLICIEALANKSSPTCLNKYWSSSSLQIRLKTRGEVLKVINENSQLDWWTPRLYLFWEKNSASAGGQFLHAQLSGQVKVWPSTRCGP